MKRWNQRVRLGVMAVASFVLLVTVLPQVASGLGLGPLANRLASSVSCSSGSVGSSSSQCGPQGTVTGTIKVTGAPKGFVATYPGAGACPYTGGTETLCPNPAFSFATNGTYTLSLAVGKWTIAGFYESNGLNGAFLGTPEVVTVAKGKTITKDLTVAYQKPAAIKGSIRITGVPTGISIDELSVLLCPSYAPYNGTSASLTCVNGYGNQQGNSSPYAVTGLPPGTWIAYPGFCSEFGCFTNAKAGKTVTLVAGDTATLDLTTPFVTPGNGLLSGTVTVTGAPSGFSDPVAVSACQGPNCETYSVSTGNTFVLLLPVGTWKINGLYLAPPFYNAIAGPTRTVTITDSHETTLDLTDPYQVLGVAAGALRVVGVPAAVSIESYTVLACPAADPWTGGGTAPECVNEYSGPGGYGYGVANPGSLSKVSHPSAAPMAQAQVPYDAYRLPTLTPGVWILYPGYQTVFASFTDPAGTKVTIAAGKTTTKGLAIPYQFPSVGAVVGTVDVIGAPAGGFVGGFEAGVQACSAPPTATSCPGQQDGYAVSNGLYQLPLSPGTWWVSGFVDVYGNGYGSGQSTTLPRKVSVTADVQKTENFTVLVSP